MAHAEFDLRVGQSDRVDRRRCHLGSLSLRHYLRVSERLKNRDASRSGGSRAGKPRRPTSPRIEALRAAWLDAGGLDEQRRICTELQLQLWQDVPYIPMGEYWQATAYRKDLLEVLPG